MGTMIALGALACVISIVLSGAFRNLYRAIGLVDHPNQSRKIHGSPIPRSGGSAIAASYALTFLIAHLTMGLLDAHLSIVWKVLPAAVVVFVVGMIDDLVGLTSWQKLAGQFVAAGIACWNGIRIMDVVGMHPKPWWSIPATILWLLACTNAFNLVDGMDGLAAGVGLFATLTIFVAGLVQHNMPLAMATVTLAGCLLGFLRYNFNPATAFLGDSGSLLVGFTLGCYGIIWTQKSATLLGMTAPIMALSIPLVDVTLAIARRFLRTQPIFSPDRGHIHHRLLDRGMSPRKVALVLYGLSSLVAVFSLLQSFSHSDQIASVVVLVFCAVAWLGVQYLEYVEFALAGRFLFRGDLQRSIKSHIELENFKKSIHAAETSEECHRLLENTAPLFGFDLGDSRLSGQRYTGRGMWSDEGWLVRVELISGDYVELRRRPTLQTAGPSMSSFVDEISVCLNGKFPAVAPAVREFARAATASRG